MARAYEQLELEQGFCVTFKKYSPEMLNREVLGTPLRALRLMLRGAEISARLGAFWLSLTLDSYSGTEERNMKQRAEELRQLLTDLGPAYVKAGQVLSNRPDIIREDYMNELCVLQDDVPAFPDDEAFKIIEGDLGRPIDEVFSSMSAEPVAAASLGQVYRGKLRGSGEEVAVKVQRPGIEPIILRDLMLFRILGAVFNTYSLRQLGCDAVLVVDEFGEKLMEELDYTQEARNIEDFYENFKGDQMVKIPKVYRELSGAKTLVMEWIDGIRCTDPKGISAAGIDIDTFIRRGVVSGLRQLLEFGLFHGDPHPGNIFAMRDGRIAYVDFGNVAELSNANKQVLIDAVVHAVNEDYVEMAGDFARLGFLSQDTDITPIVPALESIWQDSRVQSLQNFNFRTVTARFNTLVFQYPIRIPERFSLVIRSLLTQEGICMTLKPDFKFLEVAYPYVARRLLTDPDSTLRTRLLEILFKDGRFQWNRLENLILLAKGEMGDGRKLDMSTTIKDGARVVALDPSIRRQLILALTEGQRLHVNESLRILQLLRDDVEPLEVANAVATELPNLARDVLLDWSSLVLARR